MRTTPRGLHRATSSRQGARIVAPISLDYGATRGMGGSEPGGGFLSRFGSQPSSYALVREARGLSPRPGLLAYGGIGLKICEPRFAGSKALGPMPAIGRLELLDGRIHHRLRAARRAWGPLCSVVRPDDVVADVGAGSATPSWLAWRAGSRARRATT